MTADAKQATRVAYSRLETDQELADRYYRTTGDRMLSWRDSAALDVHVNSKGVYRRIVEDVA